MRSTTIFAVAVFGFVFAAGAQDASKPSCAVTGFINQVDNKDWHDGRVGLGVRAMLAQSFFETGNFAMLEENPEIKGRLEDLSKAAWLDEAQSKLLDTAAAVVKSSGAAFIASGKVFYFGKPRTRASLGPAHFESDEVVIKIEVTLADARSGKKMTAIGNGKAATTATTGLFTFHGENLDADASMVGTATKKAIDDAVGDITKKYKKVYKVK
jgi:curli biogenesis system outer membrane secretion channel CsgG